MSTITEPTSPEATRDEKPRDEVTKRVIDGMPRSTPRKRKTAASAAEKIAANDSNGVRTGQKSGAKTGGKKSSTAKKAKRASKYPPEIVAAVAKARHLSGHKKGADGKPLGDKTVAYAGPKEHVMVRTRVTELLTKDSKEVTAANVLALTGIKSQKLLREIATFEADKTAMAPMRKLSAEFRGDNWAMGRYLAAIVCAFIDDLKSNGKTK